ncbi:PIN domain-containing protein [Candidatus Woesearchaeota archaeon]|nr:PIN domain-containing protein [Candidatus Woesearchaeota archaeon]
MYVLDSSAFIELLKESPAGKKIAEKIRDMPAITTVLTANEILIGAKGLQRKTLEKLFEGVEVIEYDKDSALKSVEIEEALMKKGQVINKVDMFIAGICLANNKQLVTLDKHFKRIPELKAVFV